MPTVNFILTRRKSAIPRSCEGNWSRVCEHIARGDIYLELVALPRRTEVATKVGRPVRLHVCAYCAVRRGWGWMLEPLHQAFRTSKVLDEFRGTV
jgi:hypothetical protein